MIPWKWRSSTPRTGQFGRPIGSFQAIKHKCADMLLEVESAKSASAYAAWAARRTQTSWRWSPLSPSHTHRGVLSLCIREHPDPR